MMCVSLRGFKIYKEFLSPDVQRGLVQALRPMLKAAPLFSPVIPSGAEMSVRMTSAGQFGWFSDLSGYRYIDRHPSGGEWPDIPDCILEIWRKLGSVDRLPDCCPFNYYGEGARMGAHQDKDEMDFSYPVVSISLGDDGLLRVGGSTRREKTESVWLSSGDVVVMGGHARLAYHSIDRMRFKSSRLLPKGGRINLTLRVVT